MSNRLIVELVVEWQLYSDGSRMSCMSTRLTWFKMTCNPAVSVHRSVRVASVIMQHCVWGGMHRHMGFFDNY